jgi:alcohol dehydrogenase class IV
MSKIETAKRLLKEFKGNSYLNGLNILDQCGILASQAEQGLNVTLILDSFPGSETYSDQIIKSMSDAGFKLRSIIKGAQPNAPLDDLARITREISQSNPDILVSFGGGSTIDAVKAANVLYSLEGDIEEYFGVGLVSKRINETGRKLKTHLAIQTASSSSAHLTKYSNITNISTGQKKLIVDNAIVPQIALFDYSITQSAPESLVIDGGLDGIAHSLEVLYGAAGKENYQGIEEIALTGIELIVEYLPQALANRQNQDAFEALGLGTDLGGYSIMVGGTNGAHLTSFSLVDVLSHGRACGIMNPYYTVFFAPAIQQPLEKLLDIYKNAGLLDDAISPQSAREYGLAIAQAMIHFSQKIGNPTKLDDVNGFSDTHMLRALTAAKNPQLKMKLENMPVPLTAEMVDEYMGPVLMAAKTGNLDLIKNVE